MKTLREYIDLVNTLSLLEWAPTPEQLKWLGGANQQDPYIMSRMPGAKPPVTWFTDPADQEIARRAKFPETEPAAPPAAVATPVADPTPAVATPLPAAPTPVAAAPTPAKPPAGQAGRPTAPNPVKLLQQKLIALGADIKDDGIMGPKTYAAMKQYGLNADGTSTAKNQAAPGEAPYTLAKDTPVGNAQTTAAANAIEKGKKNPDSLYGKTTIAQPTGPIAPTAINQGSGVGKNAVLDPEQEANARAVLNDPNVSPSDKAAMRQYLSNTDAAKKTTTQSAPVQQQQSAPAPAGQAGSPTPAAATAPKVEPRPTNKTKAFAWNQEYGATHDPRTGALIQEGRGYDEIDRLIGLVHYR